MIAASNALPRRSGQTRKVAIRAVYLDLPPDLWLAILQAAIRARVTPAELIVDVLQDIFEPLLPSRANLTITTTPEGAA